VEPVSSHSAIAARQRRHPFPLDSNEDAVMKFSRPVSAIAFAIASAIALAMPASAQTGVVRLWNGPDGSPYLSTTFGVNPPKQLSPEHAAIRERLMKRRVLEEYVEFLSPVRWPHALRLLASDCSGGSGDSTYYGSRMYYINVCYPFVGGYEKAANFLFQEQTKRKLWTPVSREALVAGMFVATLLHETGHAAFDIMDVPVFGREEDAADQMSTFLALQFGRENARTLVKGRAYFWYYNAAYLRADPEIVKPDPRNPNYPKDPAAQCWWDPFCAYSDEHGTASSACTTRYALPLAASLTGSRISWTQHGCRPTGRRTVAPSISACVPRSRRRSCRSSIRNR
jgi:hypothetical protein